MKRLFLYMFSVFCLTGCFAISGHAQMNNIAVFGSTSSNISKSQLATAYQFGQILGQQQKTLIYNGSIYGLSGAVYKGATESKARIVNISIPDIFDLQCPVHHECRKNETVLKETLSESQNYASETADIIVILPGDWETLKAFSDYVAAVQMGTQKKKPILFLNINHYWDNLRYQLDEMKRQKEISETETDYIAFIDKPRNMLSEAAKLQKQIEKNATSKKKQKITVPTSKGSLTIHY